MNRLECFEHSLDRGANAGLVGNVDNTPECRAPQFPAKIGEPRLVTIEGGDTHARLRQCDARCPPEPRRRAGHDCNFSIQLHESPSCSIFCISGQGW